MAAKKNEVALKEETAVITAEMAELLGQDAGTGFANVTAKDIAIPYYGILQALSPQVKRGPAQIEGAKEGDIFNTVTMEVIPGDTGIFMIPCAFEKMWVEWKPRDEGGGLVKQHKTDEILKTCKPNDKGRMATPEGTEIVDTAYHYVLRVWEDNRFERAIISMTSTQLKKSRRWLAQQMNLQVPVNGKMINPPPFSHMYHVTTQHEEKDNFSWFGWNIAAGPRMVSNLELYRIAKKFAQDVMAGVVEVAPPPPPDDGAPASAATGEVGKQAF